MPLFAVPEPRPEIRRVVDETLLRRRRRAAVSALRSASAHAAADAILNGDPCFAFASHEQTELLRDRAAEGDDAASLAMDALGLLWAVLP